MMTIMQVSFFLLKIEIIKTLYTFVQNTRHNRSE